MEKETSFQFRKLIQQIAPNMKVFIVDNDRCEPHGTRDCVKWVIVSHVTILVGLATLPCINGATLTANYQRVYRY
ncbi:hypothetical protein [Enterobacter hormaechei]|uniref:hypothetical protein n=1 Tax=Enterobacter hormaechei TaxID=158836 RepID=UPI0015D4E8C2|nr:hypothetical protein [Enterobacter hormaechei]